MLYTAQLHCPLLDTVEPPSLVELDANLVSGEYRQRESVTFEFRFGRRKQLTADPLVPALGGLDPD